MAGGCRQGRGHRSDNDLAYEGRRDSCPHDARQRRAPAGSGCGPAIGNPSAWRTKTGDAGIVSAQGAITRHHQSRIIRPMRRNPAIGRSMIDTNGKPDRHHKAIYSRTGGQWASASQYPQPCEAGMEANHQTGHGSCAATRRRLDELTPEMARVLDSKDEKGADSVRYAGWTCGARGTCGGDIVRGLNNRATAKSRQMRIDHELPQGSKARSDVRARSGTKSHRRRSGTSAASAGSPPQE